MLGPRAPGVRQFSVKQQYSDPRTGLPGMRNRFMPILLASLALTGCGGSVQSMAAEAPEFTHAAAADWINSPPIRLADLRGDVVLVEFWTFDCYNCRNTLPWLKAIHSEYACLFFLLNLAIALGYYDPYGRETPLDLDIWDFLTLTGQELLALNGPAGRRSTAAARSAAAVLPRPRQTPGAGIFSQQGLSR